MARERAVYAIGKPAEPGTRILSTETLVSPPAATTPPVTPPSPVSDNPKNSSGRKFLYAGVAAVVVAAIFGGGMRVGHQGATADSPSNTVPATKAVPAARTIAPKSSPPAAQAIKSPPPVTKLTAPVTTPAPPLAKSPVVLAISPWGEVYVDDIMKGVSPPLKALSLTPGTHTIEVRNPGFPAYVKTIVAKPGVEIRIQHKF